MIKRILKRLSKIPVPIPHKNPRRAIAFMRSFLGRPFNVAGLFFLSMIMLAAIFADFIASETPIAFMLDDELYLFPGRFKPVGMENPTNEKVLLALEDSPGWALLPLVPYGPNQIKTWGQIRRLYPPDGDHLLGTDDKGRDVLARMVHGARSALAVGLGSVALYLLVAVILGATAGYFGGRVDRLTLRLIESLSSFPTFFLIIALQGLLGATSLVQLILAIGLTRWTDVARLTRGEVLRVSNEDFVLAARALGLGHLRVLATHVLPQAMGPAYVAATFGVAGAILIESTLSFLGFGVPPTTASWGHLLTDAFQNTGCYWLTIFPGLAIFFTILSINIVGEGLRESLDPSR